jgi:putative FmdB family regulatory protein
MPTYVYQCDKCGVQFERRQKVNDDPVTDCPECEGRVRRVMQPVGIVFKGSGWYCTDSRGKQPTALPGEIKTPVASPKGTEESPKSESPKVESTTTAKTAAPAAPAGDAK